MSREKHATKADRKRWLYDVMAAYCEPKGFHLIPSKNQFRKTTEIGFQTIILSISGNPAYSLFELHLGIRNHAIERMAYQFTNGSASLQQDSMSLVASTAKLQNLSFQRFKIESQTDVKGAMQTLFNFLDRKGLEWLDQHQTIDQIDQALNQLPLSKSNLMPNQIYRCYRGLIAAQFNNAPNYLELESAYTDYLQQLQVADYRLHTFYQLKYFLRSYSIN